MSCRTPSILGRKRALAGCPIPTALALASLLLALAAVALPAAAQHEHHGGHGEHAGHLPHHGAEGADTEARSEDLEDIPDVVLTDQDGREVHFYRDLVRDRVVAMNFVFTTCTTICRPMGAIFSKLRRELGERAGRDVHLISVSVDPVTDTPERLRAWSEQLGRGPGWTLVTGPKERVDRLLKALEVFTPDFTDHTPTVLVGNDRAGTWKRAYGLAPTAKLLGVIEEMAELDPPQREPGSAAAGAGEQLDRAAEVARAREHFSDVVLIDQHGEERRFYSDLLHGKTVVINPFFTSCTGVCPVLSAKVAAIQEHLGERLGKDVHLLSISVDPETDTVERLAEYAERFHARRGWYFLSGEKENVDRALHRIGQYVEDREGHSNIMIIGNEPAGRWRKSMGLGPTKDLIHSVEEVLAAR